MEPTVIAFSGSRVRPISWEVHENAAPWHLHQLCFLFLYGIMIGVKEKITKALKFTLNR